MFTLDDLRYLLRLVRYDFWEGRDFGLSGRVEGKLVEMIGGMKGGDRSMGKTSKAAPKKKTAAKPKSPIAKKVKR